jgi:hypothetical protein
VSLQTSTIIPPHSHTDKEDGTEVHKLLHINAELKGRLQDDQTTRLELVAENDELQKAQIQLQEQNSKLQHDCQLWNDRAVKVRHFYRTLQAEFQSLQERYEEKCRQLREHERQHPQQERMKQENYDELQQPLQLQAGQQYRDGDVKAEAASAVVAYSEMVPREHGRAEEVEEGSSDGEDVDGRDSEEEDSDERPSKRQVMAFI